MWKTDRTFIKELLTESSKDTVRSLIKYFDLPELLERTLTEIYIERYVNTILESSQEYGKRTKELEEENKRLKQQLEEALNANGHTAE